MFSLVRVHIVISRCGLPASKRVLQHATTHLKDRAFAAAGRLWKSLPAELRQPDLSLGQFRRTLNTHLFC